MSNIWVGRFIETHEHPFLKNEAKRTTFGGKILKGQLSVSQVGWEPQPSAIFPFNYFYCIKMSDYSRTFSTNFHESKTILLFAVVVFGMQNLHHAHAVLT